MAWLTDRVACCQMTSALFMDGDPYIDDLIAALSSDVDGKRASGIVQGNLQSAINARYCGRPGVVR